MATVYTYSSNINDDFIKCIHENDSWQEAVNGAADAEEKTFEFARMIADDATAIKFIQHHRVIFFDDEGNGDAMGVEVPKTDEPTMYRLYVGTIGNDLMLTNESDDCNSLVDRFRYALDMAHGITALIDKEQADECKNNFRGVIISTTDRNFIKIL